MASEGRIAAWSRLCIIYGAAVVGLIAWLLVSAGSGEVPHGVSGQVRSASIPLGWVIPAWAIVFWCLALTALLLVPTQPLVGVLVYVAVAHFLPVHKPEWIYMLSRQLLTWVSMATVAGWALWAMREPGRIMTLRGASTWLMAALVVWYAVCLAAFVAGGGSVGALPLQFHPLRIVDACVLLIVASSSTSPGRDTLLFAAFAGLVLITRYSLLQTTVTGDGDIAALAAMAFALAWAGLMSGRWLPFAGCSLIAVWSIVVVFQTRNRAALIAVLVAALSVALASRRRLKGMLVAALVIALAGWWFGGTEFASRFVVVMNAAGVDELDPRIPTWRAGIAMAFDHPLFGVGPGNFSNMIGNYDRLFAHHTAHNVLVDVFAETGFVGLLLYCGFLGASAWMAAVAVSQGRDGAAYGLLAALAAFFALGVFLSFTFMGLAFVVAGLLAAHRRSGTMRMPGGVG